ncbi:glycosyltransferase family 2 protein [Rhodococcoides kyotonense]|uniref:Sugar transferase n=1 Tax=Rhodococcoides kyotonense TaxID=398843 RepID=A0A177Y710_9NOCA|nr:galactosyltransferase-related protein [Rhodococcus kyotonensis]OAK51277.1 sugar transferase [Rhodococcus kyotonensis]
MNIAVVTVVSGRHEHLAGQLRGLAESSPAPWLHVVVAMGDDAITDVVAESGSDAAVVSVDAPRPQLPIAHARNTGATTAIEAGADVLVFLDVDCIPGTDMLRRYADAARSHGHYLLCGPVTYLPPKDGPWATDELVANTRPHTARPDPLPGIVEEGDNYDLFWSLSFGVTPATWASIGGFFEGYSGYGGEDTDFAATARAAGVGLGWVGGAHAYHQHHPVSSPPVEHLDDIVRNSAVFHRRWNRWPMEGWLTEFERRGLITRTQAGTISRIH